MGFLGKLAALPKLSGAVAGRGGGAWRRPARPCAGVPLPLPARATAAPHPPPGGRAASSRALGKYEEVFRSCLAEPEKVWGEVAEQIQWYKPWVRTLERGSLGSASWFVGGELNICYNAVDRHVENGRGDQIAIIYDSPVTNTKEKITYKELLEQSIAKPSGRTGLSFLGCHIAMPQQAGWENFTVLVTGSHAHYNPTYYVVSKLADVMIRHGVKKGDRVVIYMPMIPQTVYCMLACARIGAIHSLIFGGFASKELSVRIDHAKPKLIVTASFGVEPKRKVEYISLLEAALARVQSKPDKVLIYQRPNLGHVPLTKGRDLDWEEELAKAQCSKCVSVPSDHPLYILYTSGTTGLPKGVVRPTGGYAVMLNWTMSAVYGLKPGEVWWAASDLGWVVGHSYICYGPLLHGNTTVLYEGKPVGTPDAGAYFRVLAEHEVAAFFTSPTAIRAIRQQDPEAALGKQYSLKRFRMMFVAGEHCDVDTLEWSKRVFKVPVLDHWWQTESGSAITASCIGLGNSTTPPPGQAGKPVPGYNVMILDENKKPVKAKTLGNIVVKLPLPPGAFSGLWENQETFQKLYFQKFPGYYDTMDAGYMDEDGYLYVLSRADDVINVAGHRISAGAIEECILFHPAVADCAVVGQEDPLKGHVPFALCVLKQGIKTQESKILQEIVERVRTNIGPVAAFQKGMFVTQLPKTRSGKIPRSALSALVSGKPYKITPTIEDASVFKHIEELLKKN
ncbi:acyl-CoA synthetase short-chain family member 3, mitochondrial isoform X2 [Motacilla alba alba]|uniref:acyl-CoA synthetase short-chain family member 3, mitochondrial isoform X2 n=1 Tax=Motacilla alba alba TaxID=1094192 RepID=UPI0018D52856|nr:acyl-CoA synthetase short-chain family member 3, mitochondrial isoform X2 [Motacilla alba alba]